MVMLRNGSSDDAERDGGSEQCAVLRNGGGGGVEGRWDCSEGWVVLMHCGSGGRVVRKGRIY